MCRFHGAAAAPGTTSYPAARTAIPKNRACCLWSGQATAHAELVKDGEKLKIAAQGVDPLERQEESELPLLHGTPCLLGRAAEREEPRGLPHLGMEIAYLPQGLAQRHLGDVFACDEERADQHVDPRGTQVVEIETLYDAGLPSSAKTGDVHQKVVMGIDDDGGHERSHSEYRDSRTPRVIEIAKSIRH